MIDLTSKKFSNILERMLLNITTDINKREGSLIRTSLSAAAWAIEGIYLELQYIQRQAYAETADGQYLDYIVASRGVTRKPSTAAVRVGTFDVMPPVGTRFGAKNQTPQIVYTVTTQGGSVEGNYTALLTCEENGTIGNSYVGDLLAIDIVPGLTSATLTEISIEGTEEETDSALRTRYFETFGTRPFGGNIASYRTNILEIEGVGAVQVFPTFPGVGQVLCYIVNDEYKPALPDLLKKVQDVICPPERGDTTPSANGYGLAPIGAVVTIDTPEEFDINISVSVDLAPSYTIEMIREKAETSIKEYIESCAKKWGRTLYSNTTNYTIDIYHSHIIAALLSIDGIENVHSISINDDFNQLYYISQSPEMSKIPIFKTLKISL